MPCADLFRVAPLCLADDTVTAARMRFSGKKGVPMNVSLSQSPNLIVAVVLAICLAGLGGMDAIAQSKGKLGTADVAIKESGGSMVVLYQGREFGRFAAPSGRQRTVYCCTDTECSPGSGPACDIVIDCRGQSCTPQ